jgi:hypothetical protein
MILYYLRPDGAFIAGNTKTGLTAYAYPTSPHAIEARTKPAIVAERMMAGEVDRVNLAPAQRAVAMLRDAERMFELDAHGSNTVRPHQPSPRVFIPPQTYRDRPTRGQEDLT